MGLRVLTMWVESDVAYSVCTFVTEFKQYEGLVKSFVDHGFSYSDCEYIYVDNSETNQYDAYRGINKFLTTASGRYVIICHQDVLLMDDGRQKLDAVLKEGSIGSIQVLGRLWKRRRRLSWAAGASPFGSLWGKSTHRAAAAKGERSR